MSLEEDGKMCEFDKDLQCDHVVAFEDWADYCKCCLMSKLIRELKLLRVTGQG